MPNIKKNSKKLSAFTLKSAALRYLLAHPQKTFSPRQLAGLLKIDNNKDSVEHALRQLELSGTVQETKGGRFGAIAAGQRSKQPTTSSEEGVPDAETAKVVKFVKTERAERTDATEKKPREWKTDREGSPERPAKPEREGKTEREWKTEREIKPERTPKPEREWKTDRDVKPARMAGKSSAGKLVEGIVDMTRTGAAYVVNDTMNSDIYVPQRHVNGALHGDKVVVSVFPDAHRRKRDQAARKPEGEIMKVLQRATEFFIGTFRKGRQYGILVPDNPSMPVDIMIPLDMCGEAIDGEKVVVHITDWQEGRRNVPVGKVTQTLGKAGGNEFEMKKILINAGFELTHSEEAQAEANAIPDTISPQEIERRRDFRGILTFTIDPEDAKDFDDALSFQQLENGNFEIGVHIADVTHYLKPDSPLDREAYIRSTSVYLADRCLPMLPEKLSNNLCSLVPLQDRLTFSTVFEFDAKNKIIKRWFGKSVIHSDKRFSYEDAQTILDNKPSAELKAQEIYPQLEEAIGHMRKIAKKMRKEREKNGAIGFESDEVRFHLDENGVPLEAFVKERKEAHMFIEDFMLLANKEVAVYMDGLGKDKQEVPFIYRIHDLPNADRVMEFARFAAELGHPIKVDTPKQIAQSFNELTVAARTDEKLKLLEPLAIRTMAKAVYSTENIGHYGLGFSHYCHFTSPIRRYSDVLAHRILDRNLEGRTDRMDKSKLEEKCKHISAQEKKAADAERESIKLKQAEFISQHIGEEFEGRISGMIEKGIFVELMDSRAEGLLDFKFMDDQYVLEEGKLRAHGRRSGHTFRMGDKVNVRIAGVNIERRQIEMEIVD